MSWVLFYILPTQLIRLYIKEVLSTCWRIDKYNVDPKDMSSAIERRGQYLIDKIHVNIY